MVGVGIELAAELARVDVLLAHTGAANKLCVPSPPQRSPLARAATLFGLDPFERWVLTLAAAAELEPRVPLLLARRPDNLGAVWPTIGLTLLAPADAAPHGRTHVFAPSGALRTWNLVEIEGNGPLPSRIVRLGAGVASLLCEQVTLDALAPLDTLELDNALRATCDAAARRLAAGERPTIVIAGAPRSGRDAIAAAIAGTANRRAIIRTTTEHADGLRRLVRDARWFEALAIARDVDVAHLAAVPAPLLASTMLVGDATLALHLAQCGIADVLTIDVPKPSTVLRAHLWNIALPGDARADDLDLSSIASRFRIGPAQVATAARLARAKANGSALVTRAHVEAACRAVSTSALDALAQPLSCPHTLDDLIIPAAARRELALAIAWAKTGSAVFAADGAGSALDRGAGLACLFHGPSGTGKTLAARVLGNAVGLAVYRVDLSQVMDKYIGETEKRLERLFTEAERGNAILFFDEADVLFARRTEISDARDRYANLETGYLLQRIERHPGIVILATNLRDNLDPAFLRRIHVIAELPQPKAPERAMIWRRLLPASHAADVDVEWLAQHFGLTGGEINNAIATSLLVAAAPEHARPVSMADLVFGVWREVTKSGRLVEASQFGAWADQVLELVRETRIARA